MKNRLVLFCLFQFLVVYFAYADSMQRVWIYFADKGPVVSKDIDLIAKQHLSQHAIERRAQKSTPIGYDFTDLPLHKHYIEILKQKGIKIIHKSKWFNAVSAYADEVQLAEITNLEFVKKVESVKSFTFEYKTDPENSHTFYKTNLDYGPSFNQNNMIGIPAFHSRGYSGQGVRIALFDTGFKTTHSAFNSLNVISVWDFVENDNNVTGYPGETHGAQVLGVIAGYSPGNLIGPAYSAEYILAKTDDYYTETHRDEDNWVAAAEWADSLGADIISSSVGYNIFDTGEGNYTYQDMDGNTTIVTKAADLAVKKGMAVFNSAGNEGNNSWQHIIAPADGDSVIAIGNVTSNGIISSSSSRGPTADGRIKPDLVAQGTGVVSVSNSNNSSYSSVSGTSFSTPLAAGAGALVLSLIPYLTPMQLYDTLITNASSYSNPNNEIGYGIPNIEIILQRVENEPAAQIDSLKITPLKGRNYIEWTSKFENKINNWTILRKDSSNDLKDIAEFSGLKFSNKPKFYTYADFEIDENLKYLYYLKVNFVDNTNILIDSATVVSLIPSDFKLLQNFPNPFNGITNFIVEILNKTEFSLEIYNILGQKIKTLQSNINKQKGFYNYIWDGTNNVGKTIGSGVYIAVLKSKNDYKAKKIILVK